VAHKSCQAHTLVLLFLSADPGPVNNLTIQQQNSRSVKLSWKAPKNSELFEICIYATNLGWSLCQVTSGEEETIRELDPEATYTIRVTAVRLDENNNIAARGTSQAISAQTICESKCNNVLLLGALLIYLFQQLTLPPSNRNDRKV